MSRKGNDAMPKFKDDTTLEQHKLAGSNYGYTAARPDQLTATEYTLAQVVFDESGSTSPFARQMEKALQTIVRACRMSPRADNLMLRTLNFGSRLREVHGFKPLNGCHEADYDGAYQPGGGTALFDSSHNAVEATNAYARQLSDNDFQVNAVVFVLTDGDDNESKFKAADVGKALQSCVAGESMESIISILIGVNVNGMAQSGGKLDDYLKRFAAEAGFTQYVGIENLDDKALAKLCEFVSKSISSQSQALGTGGPSKTLDF
jgi:uncharacterized protein YegL